jgi:hypothetical protein
VISVVAVVAAAIVRVAVSDYLQIANIRFVSFVVFCSFALSAAILLSFHLGVGILNTQNIVPKQYLAIRK